MAESKLIKTGYEIEDIQIMQAPISEIRHRSECNTKIKICGKEYYPVIVAPMGAVTDEYNYKTWLDNGFMCVVPRTVDFEKRLELSKEVFASFSLKEAEDFCNSDYDFSNGPYYICVDIAHGTMSSLYNVCKTLKAKYGNENIVIMTGNVANPLAYDYYADAGIDFMRCNVGTGSRCLTSVQLGVHMPSATLLDELRMRKENWESTYGKKGTEIIFDGGVSNFDTIQKALALGAFAVMSGNIFAKSWEACGEIRWATPKEDDNSLDIYDEKTSFSNEDFLNYLNDEDIDSEYIESPNDEYCGFYLYYRNKYGILLQYPNIKYIPYREYYGMASKKAQKLTNGEATKTSEGNIKPIKIEYHIGKWAENMKDYLASCMSYCGVDNIDDFRKEAEVIISLSGDKSFKK